MGLALSTGVLANTNTQITTALPEPSRPYEAVLVRVAVRENPGISIAGDPQGTVLVSDGAAGDVYTSSCSITLTGAPDEVGECVLEPKRAGRKALTAQYLGFGAWEGSTDTEAHIVRAFRIVKLGPSSARVNQEVTVVIDLDLAEFGQSPAPTGTVTISDGTDSCVITLPASQCLWTSATVGLKQLQASYSGDANYPALVSSRVPLDVVGGFPERISVSDREAIPAPGEAIGSSQSGRHAVSADGRFIAFSSDASNLGNLCVTPLLQCIHSLGCADETDFVVRGFGSGSKADAQGGVSGADGESSAMDSAGGVD